MKSTFIVILTFLIIFSSRAQTPRINFKIPDGYPEGVVFDQKKNLFYVSSVKTGTIGTVDMSGNYKAFLVDSSLKSSFGMKVDDQNHLWVCICDPNYSKFSDSTTFKKMARIICIDLATGKKIKDIDLASLYNGKHFINDVAIDKKGNLFLTDSFSPVIYKVDAEGKASLFAQSDLFKAPEIGLNGIVCHPDGYLLVVNNNTGALYKVDMNDPSKVTRVKVKTFFLGGDGLLLDKQNNLIVVQNKGIDKVSSLASTDNFESAEVKMATAAEDRFANPSTATFSKDKIYVVNAKLNEISDKNKRPSQEFSLQLVEFKPAK